MKTINQTIVAPTTNLANQAIALIRISGDTSFEIVNHLLKKPLSKQQNVYFKKLYTNNELVDEVVITTFVAPKSFTGEDVVEIACHGGILNTQRILKLIINHGARMAQKGEFTQRAFLNNKLDLIQAEGINDMIFANNELALKIGAQNMAGLHNQLIVEIKNQLLDIISRIQVSIDYPDYDDVEGSSVADLTQALGLLTHKVDGLLKRSKMANKNANGIKTAIVGKTNVGKSSLLNALINEDKAIVTNIAGTTRDIVTGIINLENLTLDLIDTAGIRKTTDTIEKIGITKSFKMIESADLVLLVVNAQEIDDHENLKIMAKLKNRPYLLVVNKTDLITQVEINNIQKRFKNVVFVSALKGDIMTLVTQIEQMYLTKELTKNDELILINLEQINLVEQISVKMNQAWSSIKSGIPIDMVGVDLNDAWQLMGELIGEQYDEEIIDNIFKKYCLGK